MFKNRLKNEKGRKSCFSYKVLSVCVAIMTLSVFLTACIERTDKYVKDYEYVWNLLESNYPYYRYIENEGVDIENLKERYRDEVINIDDEESFAEILSRMFNELGGLDHLSVVDNNTYIGYWSVLNSG